jgi:LPS O-antigen subunit length determinant protein (WzzB/FepE family)
MKRNTRNYEDTEIDLRVIIIKLLNEKVLILSISFIFMIAGYIYGVLQPKIYKTEITIRPFSSNSYLLDKSIFDLPENIRNNFVDVFNYEFKNNILSADALVEFIENNNQISDFKIYLKEKNISASNYFDGKLIFLYGKEEKNREKNLEQYYLTHSHPLSGEKFLIDYTIFTQQQAMKKTKEMLLQMKIAKINTYQENLKIAEKINLADPLFLSGGISSQPNPLYLDGTKVLSLKALQSSEKLNIIKNLKFDYNIIEKSTTSLISRSPINCASIALLSGLFFSLILVYIKSILYR